MNGRRIAPRHVPVSYDQRNSFGPNLDFEASPLLGFDHRAHRARVWRCIFCALGLFWGLVIYGVVLLIR